MLFYRITEFSKAYPAGIEADINTNDPRTPAHAILPAWAQHSTKPCEKQEYRMRLRPAAADDAGQTERLQRMEERLTRVEVTMRVLVGLAVAILVLQLQPFLS